ncbi:MAG: hypothetical protein U0704_00995 [Candidatus Eisenbacteria bacterium]
MSGRRIVPIVLLSLALAALAAHAAAPTAPAAKAVRRSVPAGGTAVRRPAPAALKRPAGQVAFEAKVREDEGDYAGAVARLRELRGLVAPDADLELSLALDEMRSGQPDSGRTRLGGALLGAALADTGTDARRREYPFEYRDAIWRSGAFDGWNWYVARARAEAALGARRWSDAEAAARLAVAARPLAGKEHLLLAVAAGRAGHAGLAASSAERAVQLDPTLPEAHYLSGLWHWRGGRRAEARAAFEAAIARDSSFRLAALALARLQLPGMPADSLPARFLLGRRRVAMLTSAVRPKQEETPRFDTPAGILGAPELPLDAADRARLALQKPLRLYVTVYVDERGRPVVNDLPYAPAGFLPDWLVGRVTALAGTWKFQPARRLGNPTPCWATLELVLNP